MSKNKKKVFFSILGMLLILIPNNGYATILTVFRPLGFIAAAIADKVTKVEVILPNGATVQNYYFRPLDLIKIKNSDFIILIGDEIEPFFLKKAVNYFKKKTVVLSKVKKINFLLTHDINLKKNKKKQKNTLQNKKEINNILYDMHIWLSPQIALESSIAIHDMLLKLIPQKKNILDANLKNFKLCLSKTNKDIKKNISSIKEKKYFTFHNAYKYFENFYGLHPLGRFKKYPGIQTSIRYLYEVRNQILKKKARCIFTEPQFHSNIIDVITRGNNIQKGSLDLFGTAIPLVKNSYVNFLVKLSNQYISCLKNI
ncbi:zinc ABC transporter substrate-binding protein ZnuA [Buchnera aphidicola]|nr:zinc ABC transporter substrate-binding protein ZnuA [Buchnera aphidicola]